MNSLYEKYPTPPLHDAFGRPIKKFGKKLFEQCVYQPHRTKGRYMYGPKGILRLVGRAEKAPKRWVPKGDTCPTM